MSVAPRRDTEHSNWGAGQPNQEGGSSAGGDHGGRSRPNSSAEPGAHSTSTGLFRSPSPEPGKVDVSYESGVGTTTYRTVQTEFDR